MGHNSREVFFFLGQELLLDFAAWIDLTSNADNMITVTLIIKRLSRFIIHAVSYRLPLKFQSIFCFDSLERQRADDLRVYQFFTMPLNHQAGYKVL